MKTNTGTVTAVMGTIVSSLFIITTSVPAQQDPSSRNLYYKLGLEGGLGFVSPDDVNKFIDEWTVLPITVQGTKDVKLNFNISGYLGLMVGDLIEIRPEVGFFIAPKSISYWCGSDLDILIWSICPGISANLTPKIDKGMRLQFGVGLFEYFAAVKWKGEEIFPDPWGAPQTQEFSETWKGNKLGIHATVGLDLQILPNFGFSLSALFKHANIDELKDEQDQVVKWNGIGENFSLDLSGFEFRLGGYLAF